MYKKQKWTIMLLFIVAVSVFLGACTSNSNSGNQKTIESEETDIVVVGAGAGGLSAALSSAEAGNKVILLEKMPLVGGTTRLSMGYLWSVDSSINKATGKGLTEDDLFDFYKEKANGNINEELFRRMAQVSGPAVDHLLELGVPFNEEKLVAGTPRNPNLLCLTVNGGGGALVDTLKDVLVEKGVDIRLNSPAIDLIFEDGEVKGVLVEDKEKKYEIRAKKVILATGGFARDEELMSRLQPDHKDNIPFSAIGSTGDGIKMGEKVGGQIVGNGVLGIWGMNEKYGYVGNIGSLVRQSAFYVNKEGNRFENEKIYYAEMHKKLNEIEGKLAYGLFDSDFANVSDLEEALKQNLAYKADTIEELADLLKVDSQNLSSSVNSYNEAYDSGSDGEFGIPFGVMTPIKKAPFYAVEVRPTIIGTIPGLKTNQNTEVVDKDGNPIPNLYAVGELIIGNFINNEYPSTGTVVATGIYSGKIAGEEASKSIK